MARDRKNEDHRRVASAKLGRRLKPGELVDHLNENKDDNTPGNLNVTNRSAHSKVSQTPGRKSLRELQRSLSMVKKGQKSY